MDALKMLDAGMSLDEVIAARVAASKAKQMEEREKEEEKRRKVREEERAVVQAALDSYHHLKRTLSESISNLETQVKELESRREDAKRDLGETEERMAEARAAAAMAIKRLSYGSTLIASDDPKSVPSLSEARSREAASEAVAGFNRGRRFVVLDRICTMDRVVEARKEILHAFSNTPIFKEATKKHPGLLEEAKSFEGEGQSAKEICFEGEEPTEKVGFEGEKPTNKVCFEGEKPSEKSIEVEEVDDSSKTSIEVEFRPGPLGGGRSGENTKYESGAVRGDFMAWISGVETEVLPNVCNLLKILDAIVLGHIASRVSALEKKTLFRTSAMITVYPGSGARYTRHIDNPNKNGRILTALLYLNPPDWSSSDGGQLRIYPSVTKEAEEEEGSIADIEAVGGRLVLFWSDTRCPHEVLPTSSRPRCALSVWYFDAVEKADAEDSTRARESYTKEEERLAREIKSFKSKK